MAVSRQNLSIISRALAGGHAHLESILPWHPSLHRGSSLVSAPAIQLDSAVASFAATGKTMATDNAIDTHNEATVIGGTLTSARRGSGSAQLMGSSGISVLVPVPVYTSASQSVVGTMQMLMSYPAFNSSDSGGGGGGGGDSVGLPVLVPIPVVTTSHISSSPSSASSFSSSSSSSSQYQNSAGSGGLPHRHVMTAPGGMDAAEAAQLAHGIVHGKGMTYREEEGDGQGEGTGTGRPPIGTDNEAELFSSVTSSSQTPRQECENVNSHTSIWFLEQFMPTSYSTYMQDDSSRADLRRHPLQSNVGTSLFMGTTGGSSSSSSFTSREDSRTASSNPDDTISTISGTSTKSTTTAPSSTSNTSRAVTPSVNYLNFESEVSTMDVDMEAMWRAVKQAFEGRRIATPENMSLASSHSGRGGESDLDATSQGSGSNSTPRSGSRVGSRTQRASSSSSSSSSFVLRRRSEQRNVIEGNIESAPASSSLSTSLSSSMPSQIQEVVGVVGDGPRDTTGAEGILFHNTPAVTATAVVEISTATSPPQGLSNDPNAPIITSSTRDTATVTATENQHTRRHSRHSVKSPTRLLTAADGEEGVGLSGVADVDSFVASRLAKQQSSATHSSAPSLLSLAVIGTPRLGSTPAPVNAAAADTAVGEGTVLVPGAFGQAQSRLRNSAVIAPINFAAPTAASVSSALPTTATVASSRLVPLGGGSRSNSNSRITNSSSSSSSAGIGGGPSIVQEQNTLFPIKQTREVGVQVNFLAYKPTSDRDRGRSTSPFEDMELSSSNVSLGPGSGYSSTSSTYSAHSAHSSQSSATIASSASSLFAMLRAPVQSLYSRTKLPQVSVRASSPSQSLSLSQSSSTHKRAEINRAGSEKNLRMSPEALELQDEWADDVSEEPSSRRGVSVNVSPSRGIKRGTSKGRLQPLIKGTSNGSL